MPYLTSWCINSPYDQAWQLKFTCMYINTLEGVREPRALQHSMQDKAERSFHALCCPGGNYFGDKEIFYSFPWRQARAQTQAEDLIIRSGGEDEGKEMGFQSFTFTIILWSSSLQKKALLLDDGDMVKGTITFQVLYSLVLFWYHANEF